MLANPDYAASLERIADAGPDDYYTGQIAERLVADWEANGGHVTADDLADFRPEVREPVRGTYRGYTISDMPPPSGGVTLVEVLNILEGYDLASMGHNSAEYIRVLSWRWGPDSRTAASTWATPRSSTSQSRCSRRRSTPPGGAGE